MTCCARRWRTRAKVRSDKTRWVLPPAQRPDEVDTQQFKCLLRVHAMLAELKQREKEGHFINVGLIGCGAMGLGIAYQIGRTPGMRLSFVADFNQAAAQKAAEVYGKPTKIVTDGMAA